MQSTNRKYGYAYSGDRVRQPGAYSGDVKDTVILAVEPGDPRLPPNIYGSVEWPRRWAKVDSISGTSTEDFDDLLIELCEDLLNNPPVGQSNERRVFLWDNLGSHTSPVVHQTVEADYGHIIMRRSAYRPADEPIEYVFCQLADRLRDRCHTIRNLLRLVNAINCIIGQLRGFDETFDHVGYKSNH